MRVSWSPESAWPFDITLEWDLNSEPDLKGYRIYHGKMSRYEAIGLIEAWCGTHEPRNTKCIEQWQKICDDSGQPDPSCHPMLFKYDHVVDVRNVTKYTLIGLDEGAKYYFGCTAYDVDGNGSAYSIELDYKFGFAAPGKPGQLKRRDPARLEFQSELFPTIKELEKAAEEK